MTVTISRRGFIRLLSFSSATLLVLSLLAYSWYQNALHSQMRLSHHYLQSMSDLTAHVQNIDASLQKVRYANTAPMLASLSSKLWREAGLAKASLSTLPVAYLELQNTNKLLSQVGDYCVSLSREFERGSGITKEHRSNLAALQDYCDTMLSEILAVSDGVQTGSISLVNPSPAGEELSGTPVPTVDEGFTEFEEGFTAYPTLIYDGPFSDHIMEREPQLLKGKPTVSRAEAKRTASFACGLTEGELRDGNDEAGKMPSYAFSGEGVELSVTKNGGYLCYLMKSRLIQRNSISPEAALEKASAFLEALGISGMEITYYETADGRLTANYAYTENGITFYTDLIKVTVALDTGEITGYDARGFIVNHQSRDLRQEKLSQSSAQAAISPYLRIESARLCVIPSGGLHEIFCWEFRCKSEEGGTILVYLNAATGYEEQILILLIGEHGQLTL